MRANVKRAPLEVSRKAGAIRREQAEAAGRGRQVRQLGGVKVERAACGGSAGAPLLHEFSPEVPAVGEHLGLKPAIAVPGHAALRGRRVIPAQTHISVGIDPFHARAQIGISHGRVTPPI